MVKLIAASCLVLCACSPGRDVVEAPLIRADADEACWVTGTSHADLTDGTYKNNVVEECASLADNASISPSVKADDIVRIILIRGEIHSIKLPTER